MIDEFVLNIKIFLKNYLRSKDFPEDSIDIYFAEILPALFIFFTILLSLTNYIFPSIVCIIPKLWIPAHEEYSKTICWSDGTYFMKINDRSPSNEHDHEKLKIKYYQWVPVILVSLAILLTIPRKLWELFCGSLGIDINHIISISSSLHSCRNIDRIIQYITTSLKQINRDQNKFIFKNEKIVLNFENSRFFPYVVFYIILKLFYIFIAIGEIFILKTFLGMENIYFPIEMLQNFTKGISSAESGKFPIVTWCRLMIKENSDVYFRNIQCALPWNVINDKLFIIIWFLLVLGIVLMFCNIIYWTVKIFRTSKKESFLKNQLVFLENLNNNDIQLKINNFIHNFLTCDGLFLLYILETRTEYIYFQKIIQILWKMSIESNEMKLALSYLPISENYKSNNSVSFV